MKATEYITLLQRLIAEYGDLDVVEMEFDSRCEVQEPNGPVLANDYWLHPALGYQRESESGYFDPEKRWVDTKGESRPVFIL